MNIYRKLKGQSGSQSSGQQDVGDHTLGLMHLKKLFHEFRHPATGTIQRELEDKLYNMLPLFCKVFGAAPSSDMTEKFPDILQFCSHVSRLMVSEIRRRASNQSTDAASCSIVKFLEIESTEELSNGWMLLSSLNLLSTGPSALVDCMTAASLPSTLVKCLYLFFDLPPVESADVLLPGSEFTAHERRVLLQKVFVQILVRLCSHTSPAEELARKDDLTLLFSAITSWCPPHNVQWRKSAAEVLMTLSRHGLTPNVVQYIHSKGCVNLCIDNMRRVQELSPIELVEMFVTVFCFLKDSSEVSQMLLDDFRACQGYIFLSEFLLRMEASEDEESVQALRNLILLVGSLVTCGFIELKPSSASSGSLFQMPGFTVPQPSGKGVSVRNLQAFQVLQTVFLKANSSHLLSTILDVISSIYHQDNANYFILEPHNTLSQFAEKIHLKPCDIQIKLLEMLEFVVFNLNYVPCKELISLSILIKSNQSVSCSIRCMQTLIKILRGHQMYKDVYREVGLLEVFVTCLHRYAALLKEPQNGKEFELEGLGTDEETMGNLTMEALTQLLSGNNNNAGVFRECGGARCAHNMVPYAACRQQALMIVQQLVLSNGGDDDMGTLLGLMHTASTNALQLKTHILKSLLQVLRESHRTRTVFRKVGGFVYVMSVLVSMESCLADPPKAPWDTVERQETILLLKTVFSTLTVAMRYEPANARFFATEVRYASLTEAVRLLGCFSCHVDLQTSSMTLKPREDSPFQDLFNNIHKDQKCAGTIPQSLISATRMMRYLYDMALDNLDKPLGNCSQTSEENSPSLKRFSSVLEATAGVASNKELLPLAMVQKRASTGSLSLALGASQQAEPLIVHPGAVISMFHLVPAVSSDDNMQLALDLQYEACEMIKSLVRTERNQQVMCVAGLPHELLTHATAALANEAHVLHPQLQYIYERLAAQSLTPKDLRDFLRLGNPLCSAVEDEDIFDARYDADGAYPTYAFVEKTPEKKLPSTETVSKKARSNGGTVPLTRVKCLVSMTTPRDIRLHGASVTPGFVEFDMSQEGFGCLYLPSIAPQGPPTPSVVGSGMMGGADPGVVGGIGSGERLFPPQAGVTFSTWLCVDKFASVKNDPHPVRLITVVRNIQGRDENLICLHVYLSARDRALFVSTQEIQMPTAGSGEIDHDPELSDTVARFWCPELTQEGQWRHLVLIFHKAGIMKNSSVSLFIDGAHVNTQKLHYISPNVGSGGTASPSAATSVFAYIGTPPQLRSQSRLLWRQGPCHLFEDIITSVTVQSMYQMGPNYIGGFQASHAESELSNAVIIPEEKIMCGVYAHAMSLMTVAKIRKVYNKFDAKSIAKQLGMSANENATPIRILHNPAGHLSGPARSFGAILMGYLGVRTFCPRPVAKVIMNVGGTSALLGLIAMATDVEGLYAAVKALVCVVRCNKGAALEMTRTKGYQMLSTLFKKKRHLLNSHILHLTFSLVGTVDSGRESTSIPNTAAFQDLLADLEVWHDAPGELQRSLYEHFYELLTESSEQQSSVQLLQELGIVERLLHILRTDMSISRLTLQTILSVLQVLLSNAAHTPSLLRFAQFLVSLIPNQGVSEKGLMLNEPSKAASRLTPDTDTQFDSSGSQLVYNIKLRNACLEVFAKMLTAQPVVNGMNQQVCDGLQRVLGFDWLMLFLQGHLHASTVVMTMRLLLLLLSNSAALHKFREGGSGGGWMADTESVLQNRVGVLLGFNVGAGNVKGDHRELNSDMCHLPGFTVLHWLVSRHADISELYFLFMALLLGQPIKSLPDKVEFDLDSVWLFIFGVPASQPVNVLAKNKAEIIGEAAVCLLGMVRAIFSMNWEAESEGSWVREYPVTLMQFFLFLYHNHADMVPLCMTSDFLSALAACLFTYRSMSEASSEVNTPSEEVRPFPGADPLVMVKTKEGNSNNSSLTSHPARKFILDLLRMIIMDSLSQPVTSKSPPVIDLILEVSPEQSSRSQRKEFQTTILSIIMEHLLAADVLLGDQAALPLAGGSYNYIAQNVFYFASRVVDKLWQGAYTRDPNEVFEFINKLISQAKRKASGLSLDGIYKCLNRTILYQLSRPLFTSADQTNILDALHRMTSNRTLIFGPGNYDQEFFGCLCYCLLQLTDNPRNISEPPMLRTTTWHIQPDDDLDANDAETALLRQQVEAAANVEVLELLSHAAKRVWEELYICKKPAIEEIFKVSLGNAIDAQASPKISTPELNSVRPAIQDASSRVWLNYFENERKCAHSNVERIHSQLQSVSGKLQKVGQGVIRLATRKQKKESTSKTIYTTSQDFHSWTSCHTSIVKDLVEFRFQQQQQDSQHMARYLLEEWAGVEGELMRERGLWGPPVASELEKWMLDPTEGPYRMRKKVLKNDMFYVHYPYRPPQQDTGKPLRYKMATSYDSRVYHERYRSRSLVGDEETLAQVNQVAESAQNGITQNDQANDDIFLNGPDLAKGTPSLLHGLHPAKNKPADGEDDADLDVAIAAEEGGVDQGGAEIEGSQTEQDSSAIMSRTTTDNQAILRLLEEGEKISHMFRCARIQGLDTVEGLLLFGKEHCYVVDGFTLLRTKEIADIDSLPPDMHDPIIPKSGGTNQKRKCSKFAYDDIREVHKRRYLLQPIAVEVFSADGRNFLLAFPRKVRKKVHTRFLTMATTLRDSAQESVSGQKQNAKVEPGTGLISSLMGEKSVTQRWERGEISNFEYIMCLNTLAGRSYNDLMQYPVFPWIVADYEHEELDLNDPATFRDLSKPMGAQTPDRLKQFKKRYTDWDDPTGETPPYHFGTHYSSAMIVASYLLRMEPFTQVFLRLQGGHFDLADRMFHSVKDAWYSASKHNMADVKELIPEFFYLPEFLLNNNNFDLGTKQSGVALGDVVLPVWAKGDVREFIRAHREALECDYVSAHLNEWIDLVFGYKQQGPAAVDAVNVFHHLFYEGNVDIYSIDDPLKKNAVIGFINNFGQIPKQLFKKPHPQKRLSMRGLEAIPMPAYQSGPTTLADRLFFHNLDNLRPTMQPIKELKGSVGQIVHSDKAVLAVEQNKVLIPPTFNKYLAWGFSDLSLRVGNYDSDKATAVFENIDNGEILCASCPNAKIIITAGTSTVVNVWELGKGKEKKLLHLKQALYGHTEPVTCLASSSAYSLIVSGSRDRTCILWDLSRLAFVRQLRGHAAPVAAVCINDVTGDLATCAGTYLHVWSINGDEIASINTATVRNQQILCVAMSQLMEWDARNVVMTGNSDGVVRMWSLEFVEVPDESKSQQKSNNKADRPDGVGVTSNSQTESKAVNIPTRNKSALEDFKDPEYLAAQAVELGSSADSDGGASLDNYAKNRAHYLREDSGSNFSSTDNLVNIGTTNAVTSCSKPSLNSATDLMSFDGEDDFDGSSRKLVEPAIDALSELKKAGNARGLPRVEVNTSNTAVSEKSPPVDFELVTDKEVKEAVKSALPSSPSRRRKLREGFRWQKQLVFCSKLTMHTAFERKDNKDPAAVTALAASKDHKTVYVGDAKGRVYSWSVTDQPGRVMADHWVKDDGGDSCVACNTKFSFSERRHHCRNCGQLFCSKCSRFETEIRRLRILKPVRVCQACYNILKAQQAAEALARSSSNTKIKV